MKKHRLICWGLDVSECDSTTFEINASIGGRDWEPDDISEFYFVCTKCKKTFEVISRGEDGYGAHMEINVVLPKEKDK